MEHRCVAFFVCLVSLWIIDYALSTPILLLGFASCQQWTRKHESYLLIVNILRIIKRVYSPTIRTNDILFSTHSFPAIPLSYSGMHSRDIYNTYKCVKRHHFSFLLLTPPQLDIFVLRYPCTIYLNFALGVKVLYYLHTHKSSCDKMECRETIYSAFFVTIVHVH
uniref:Uncharacterized protein n=1 Tax=Amphimedon queenslandica TaxID=400682 RepID=A0A1X7UIF9_AMPQE